MIERVKKHICLVIIGGLLLGPIFIYPSNSYSTFNEAIIAQEIKKQDMIGSNNRLYNVLPTKQAINESIEMFVQLEKNTSNDNFTYSRGTELNVSIILRFKQNLTIRTGSNLG